MNSEERLQLVLRVLGELRFILVPSKVINDLKLLKETLQKDVEFEKYMEEVFGINTEDIKDWLY